MKTKKRLCVVVPFHWKAYMGGAEYQAKCIIDGLVPTQNYEIYYLARGVDPQYSPNDYEIIRISKENWVTRRSYLFDAFSLYRALKKLKPELIYQRVGGAYTGIAAVYAKRHPCKMIWHVAHENDVTPEAVSFVKQRRFTPTRMLRRLEKLGLEYAIRHCDHIVAQTNVQKNLLLENYGREVSAVIQNFHPSPPEAIEKSTDTVQVIWIANIKPWKQVEVFVRLARELKDHSRAKFIIIGKAPATRPVWYTEIEQEMAQLTNLQYLGGKSQEQTNALLANSHIFVNTSLNEGFPNTFIQAWMRQTPVVSLHVNPDGLFDDRKIGIHSGSYEALLSDVRTLIENDTLRNTMGKQACEYAFEHHSEKNIQRLIEILESEV